MRNAATERLLAVANETGLNTAEDSFAERMDAEDPLAEHRASFHMPHDRATGERYTYLVGNSLGLQHKDVEASTMTFLQKWRDQAVEGWFLPPSPWFEIDQSVRRDMASIVGAEESEVVMMNGLTVNLHLMMAPFFRPSGKRTKIMTEFQSFPSDTHALISELEAHGLNKEEHLIVVSPPGKTWESDPEAVLGDAFLSAIEQHGDEVALLLFCPVHFLTGAFLDVAPIIAAAKAKGITVGLDCAHAVGNVPLHLHDWGADFAVWCTYKYLNSGPGNMGGAFVHSSHTKAESGLHYLRGWWGHHHRSRLSLHQTFDPADGAAAFQMSTPSVCAYATLTPGLRFMSSIGVEALREKSLLLTAYLEHLLSELVPAGCIEQITPVDPARRGAQISIRILPDRLRSRSTQTAIYESGTSTGNRCDADIAQRQLLDNHIMVDSRPPDVIRIAPVPAYNNFTDVLTVARGIACLF